MTKNSTEPRVAYVEFSPITRHYYVRMDGRRKPIVSTHSDITRKDEAVRLAKQNGATEIEFVRRNAVRDLEQFLGFSHDTAKRLAKEVF